MKNQRAVVSFALVLAFCGWVPVAIAQDARGMKRVDAGPRDSTAIEQSDSVASYAILVGVNRYRDQSIPRLNYAVADAFAIRDLLVNKFGFPEENIVLLTDSLATGTNIKSAIGKLTSIDPASRVIFYFAGHGETITISRGGDVGLLVPYDANTETQAQLYASCLLMADIRSFSTVVSGRHMLFLVDACYGGLAAVTRSLDAEPDEHITQEYIDKLVTHRSRFIITAGGKGEKVIESPDWGHSAFTMALLDGLGGGFAARAGNKFVTEKDLGEYLSQKVSAYTKNRQTPVHQSIEPEDEGQFVFRIGAAAPPMVVRMQTDVDSAVITVDNRAVGHTQRDSLSALVRHGRHIIIASREGFKSDRRTIDVGDHPLDIQFSLAPILGRVELFSDPPGATVLLDGRTVGHTPIVAREVPYGKHTVLFMLLDHEEKSMNIDIKGEATQSLGAHLVATPELIARGIYRDWRTAKTTWTWVGGIMTLGMAAGTLAINSNANGSYNEYKTATDVSVMNSKYSDYSKQLKLRNVAAAGIGLCAVFTVYQLIRGVSYEEALHEAQQQRLSLGLPSGIQSAALSVSIRF